MKCRMILRSLLERGTRLHVRTYCVCTTTELTVLWCRDGQRLLQPEGPSAHSLTYRMRLSLKCSTNCVKWPESRLCYTVTRCLLGCDQAMSYLHRTCSKYYKADIRISACIWPADPQQRITITKRKIVAV